MVLFSDIRDQIPDGGPDWRWVKDIPGDSPVDLLTLPWGAVVPITHGTPFSGTLQIGVILRGCVEVSERHIFSTYRAFRPIRNIKEGEVFNDFSLIDKLTMNLEDASRPDEVWGVVAGTRSSIAISKSINKALFSETGDTSTIYGSDIYLKNKNKDNEVKIAYVSLKLDDIEMNLHLSMMITSWRRAYTYRLGPNTYNFRKKIEYYHKATPVFDQMVLKTGGKGTATYSNTLMHQPVKMVFFEAIYDALNRPIRDEPVYFDKGAGDGVLEPDVVAKDNMEFFYFPLDLTNHFVAQYFYNLCRERKVLSLDGAETIIKGKYSYNSVTDAFGGKKAATAPDPTTKSRGSNAHFWLEMTNKILTEFVSELDDYPFEVEAVSKTDFLGRPILLLQFKRKT